MTKLEKRKMIVIVVGIFILLVVIIGGGLLVFGKKDNPDVFEPNISNEVSPDQALEIFSNLTKDCSGAMVWDISLGESVEIENIEDYQDSCKTENYYSKMIGYTYDENDSLILHVNVLKKLENDAYRLDDTLIGEFLEENIDVLLDEGTTYIYTYKKVNDSYQLTKVELLNTADPETTIPENTEGTQE